MNQLGKINSKQLNLLGTSQTVTLLVLIVGITLAKFLPYYLSPVVALGAAAFLYYFIYTLKLKNKYTCVVPATAVLYSVVLYAFLTITLNLLHVWGYLEMPREFVFFTDPFIPSLILNPILFIVSVTLYVRHNKLKTCKECKMNRQIGGNRGASGVLINEFHKQIKNLILVSGILTAIVWIYYQFFYVDVNINARDSYIFIWITIIGFILDEIYFIFRYYNLYLDMKEGGEIISQQELNDLTAKTYVRYYVVKGNKVYLSYKMHDPNISEREVIDTPFFTSQAVNGLHISDVKDMIARKTNINDGELRFFYGRRNEDGNKYSILRYFYFINGDENEYPELPVEGEWVDFDKVKYIYSTKSSQLAELAVLDLTRLATIILTEKIFDENGNRKSKIRTYNPTFNLIDVKNSKLDFQEDKWIEISMNNSDSLYFRIKRWWKNNLMKSSR